MHCHFFIITSSSWLVCVVVDSNRSKAVMEEKGKGGAEKEEKEEKEKGVGCHFR